MVKEHPASTCKSPIHTTELIHTKTTENEQISPSILQTENETSVCSPRKERLMLKRHPYSRAEQQQIVDYIINTKSYKFVKGVQLWQEMQKGNTVCKGRRTWQSMKEHFLKQIVPQLHIYKNVNEKAANSFKRSLMGLPLDLEDSDSNEEQETHKKKKSISTREENDMETDLSGSDSEVNVPYQSLRKRRISDANQRDSHSKDAKITGNVKRPKHKGSSFRSASDRDGTSIAGGDTTEDEDLNSSFQRNQRRPAKQTHDGHCTGVSTQGAHISETLTTGKSRGL